MVASDRAGVTPSYHDSHSYGSFPNHYETQKSGSEYGKTNNFRPPQDYSLQFHHNKHSFPKYKGHHIMKHLPTPTTTEVPSLMCEPVFAGRNITEPKDLRNNEFIADDMRRRVDPTVALSPPRLLVPPAPPQLSSDDMDKYEVVYQETLSYHIREQSNDPGIIVLRDRVTKLNATEIIPVSNEGSMDTITSVIKIHQFPRLDSPLNGFDNKYFKDGLDMAKEKRRRGETRPPVSNFFKEDVFAMTDIFQQISEYEMKHENDPVFQDEEGNDESIQLPMMVTRSERFTIPEPNHSEVTILDSYFNFGPPASSNQFESNSAILHDWKRMMRDHKSKYTMEVQEFIETYTGMSQFYESLQNFTTDLTTRHRKFGEDRFYQAEEISQNVISVSQFFLCPDFITDPGCNSKCMLDPPNSRMNRNGVLTMQLQGFRGRG